MSVYLDLHINSDLVAGISVTRVTETGSRPDSVNTYRWEHRGEAGPRVGHVGHRYGDGALQLARKVLDAVADSEVPF